MIPPDARNELEQALMMIDISLSQQPTCSAHCVSKLIRDRRTMYQHPLGNLDADCGIESSIGYQPQGP